MMLKYRVLFQYIDDLGHPRFEFTTVVADTPEEAEAILASVHEEDIGYQVVQVVVANDFETGFPLAVTQSAAATYAARLAGRSPQNGTGADG